MMCELAGNPSNEIGNTNNLNITFFSKKSSFSESLEKLKKKCQ